MAENRNPDFDFTGQVPDEAAIEQWMAEQQARLDSGEGLNRQGLAPGYEIDDGQIQRQNWWDQWGRGAAIGMGLGIAGGYGAGYLNNAMSATPAATGATPAASEGLLPSTQLIANSGTLPTGVASGTQAAAGSGSGIWGKVGSHLARNAMGGGGLDYTTLLLGALSLLGGDDDGREPFTGAADPNRALGSTISDTDALYRALAKSGPTRAPQVEPVQIAGIPFQIGGGLASPSNPLEFLDPAGLTPGMNQPGSRPSNGQSTGRARRRTPNNG